jgi:hypothetical protein
MSIFETNVLNTIESLARMNEQDKELFCQLLVERFPNLAQEIMTAIGFTLQDQEEHHSYYPK